MYNNNSYKDSKKVKLCKNGCGALIYWDSRENAFFEADGEQKKHYCPNWKPYVTKPQDELLQGINVVNTINESLAEILLKLDRLDRKIDKLGGL